MWDCALSSIPRTTSDPDLKQIPLHRDQGVVVSRANHPLVRQRRTITVEQLASFDWVLARQSELERARFRRHVRRHRLCASEPTIETTSTTLMKSMVMQSDALTFVPRELVYWEARAKQLRVLKLPFLTWERTVGISFRARGSHSPARDALFSALRAAADNLHQ